MQKKTLGVLTAAAIAIGTAGFATSASAATPAAGLSTVTADAVKTDRNVQTVGHGYYRYYHYRPHRRCYFAGYRRVWHAYHGYVMKPVYRCHSPYYYGRYNGPRVRIRLGY